MWFIFVNRPWRIVINNPQRMIVSDKRGPSPTGCSVSYAIVHLNFVCRRLKFMCDLIYIPAISSSRANRGTEWTIIRETSRSRWLVTRILTSLVVLISGFNNWLFIHWLIIHYINTDDGIFSSERSVRVENGGNTGMKNHIMKVL